MSTLKRMFSRRWLLATLLVLAGMALCVRLGIWQLDRLEKRRAFNTRVQAQIGQPTLTLAGEALNEDLYNMEYRPVQVTGTYDFSQQVALINQSYGNEWGVHLVTPLIISGTVIGAPEQAILIDRGWIPHQDYQSGDWSKFDEPGTVVVEGVLRRPQMKAEIGGRTDPTPAPGEAPRAAWNFVNLEQIGKQVAYPLVGAYIQQAPDPAWTGLPYRTQPEIEITEGPHLSYALQWFSFAILLGLGYPFFIRRQEHRSAQIQRQTTVYD
jgi:surfeit locus 1 family protein